MSTMDNWVANDSVVSCRDCNTNFNFFNRRHHCRICGNIFCSKCTSNKRVIPEEYGWGSVAQRICNACLAIVEGKHRTARKKEASAPAPPQKPVERVDKGVDDMTLLATVSEDAIVENLKKRHQHEVVYTYIGHVLISVNPFKNIKDLYTERTLLDYRGKYIYEMPPHVYMISEMAFRDMVRECHNQCIIISGESGAGKTEASKKIMEYISIVSGKDYGAVNSASIKDVILDSNPLLEAFGNAKTIRNNNSSRFGKYMEIKFSGSGVPKAGRITNYLLEKSRIVYQTLEERNFHIFYQILQGITPDMQREFGLSSTPSPDDFHYLKQGNCFKVNTIDDLKEFNDTCDAMNTMGIAPDEQKEIIRCCLAILYIGNLEFQPDPRKEDSSVIKNRDVLQNVSRLLRIPDSLVEQSLVSRTLQSGTARTSTYNVPLNVADAEYTRDAFAKATYSRLFDYIVARINICLQAEENFSNSKSNDQGFKTIGVLDIYGFEIFKKNGFEQICINYVNERLQQIFIELTLKTEQEEYHAEKIKWEQVDFFNNKICCDLIDGKKPPGILALLDDNCNFPKGTDQTLMDRLQKELANHKHFVVPQKGVFTTFTIRHYAGDVSYDVEGFCDKNKDLLFHSLLQFGHSSESQLFSQNLYPAEQISREANRKAPTTAGFKIKESIAALVTALSACTPHYIRCIKPNEKKSGGLFETDLVRHQVKYLGLFENVRVRRAGFAYRQVYGRFFFRYRIICDQTWPNFSGDHKRGSEAILRSIGVDPSATDEVAWGVTKIFIKRPEVIFQLEEKREQAVWPYALKLQAFFRRHVGRKRYYDNLRAIGDGLMKRGGKERRRMSVGRLYRSEYVKFRENPTLQAIVERYGDEARALFAEMVWFYPGTATPQTGKGAAKEVKVRSKRIMVLTSGAIYLFSIMRRSAVGQGKGSAIKSPRDKTPRNNTPRNETSEDFFFAITRRIENDSVTSFSLSKLADNFLIVHTNVPGATDIVLQARRKAEFLATWMHHVRQNTTVNFDNKINVSVKIDKSKSGVKPLSFVNQAGAADGGVLDIKTFTVSADNGLPPDTTSNPNRNTSSPSSSTSTPTGGRGRGRGKK